MEKITRKSFLQAVVEGAITDELVEYAKGEIIKLDNANAKKRGSSKAKVRSEEDLANMETIVSYLKEVGGCVLSKDVYEHLVNSGIDITKQKVSGLLKVLVQDERVERIEPEKRSAPIEYKAV